MQTAAPSRQKGLTFHQPKRADSRHERAPSFSGSAHASPSSKDAIARSMSRYRGNRPAKPPVNMPVSPPIDFSSIPKQSEASHGNAPSGMDVKEDNAGNEAYGPRKQRAGTIPSLEQGPESKTQVNQDRSVRLSKRGPDLSRRESISQAHKSPVKGEAHAPVSDALDSKTQRPQGQPSQPVENDNSHVPAVNTTHRKHTDRANGHEQRSNGNQHNDGRGQQKFEHGLQKKALVSPSPGLAPSRLIPTPKKSFTERMADHISKYQSASKSDSKSDLKRMISTPIAIGSGGEAAVPEFDAPISAVNAGERRVIVKSRDFIISLPVTPSTTSVDIIRSLATQNPGTLDVDASVLLESFKQLGLERPLRRYEHIRDVLNSWDTDMQNTLVVEASPTGGNDDDLNVRNVSKEQPGDSTVYLYHSQKPGHWDKRWITLRSDGQVVMKKNSNESANICHLSDFDIYVPTPRQIAKKIKPPKKICFAVKSQQKSSMFMSTANFVHFFSTGDKKLATAWYKAVQEWRSWYLVNVMGEGQSMAKDKVDDRSKYHRGPEHAEKVARPSHGHGHILGPAVYEKEDAVAAHPTPRKIQPSSHSSRTGSGDRPGSGKTTTEANSAASSTKPNRNRSAPPVSFPKKLIEDANIGAAIIPIRGPSLVQGSAAKDSESQPFNSTGLLGRTYSQRQKPLTNQDRTAIPKHSHAPAPNPATLPGGDTTAGLKRASSQRQKPKPLVDLTPVYQEPPQHSRKGKGIVPEQMPAGGLVDIATSPEVAIPIPPTKVWRRAGGAGGDGTV